jgi:hypothetical protein
MRLAIAASLAIAVGVASFEASACSNTNDYNNRMAEVQKKYEMQIDAANKAYVDGRKSTVELVYASAHRAPGPRYYYVVRDDWPNWQTWQSAVNTAVAEYMRDSQAAYNNYVCNW